MASEGFTLATDIADYLVRKGIAFRKSHHVVGQIVHFCIQNHKQLHECTLEELKSFHKSFDADVFPLLNLMSAVDRRVSLGGTASSRVQEAIVRGRMALEAGEQASKI
jgi:argininosuccinate lyase